MVGKTIELLAFEINSKKRNTNRAERLRRIENLTNSSLVDLSGFTFDRDEANDYTEVIVTASIQGKCEVLYSEDMQHNLIVDKSMTIINPFL